MTSGEMIALAVGGIFVVGVVGYGIYSAKAPTTVAVPLPDGGASIDQGSTERTAWANLIGTVTSTVGGIVMNEQTRAQLAARQQTDSSQPNRVSGQEPGTTTTSGKSSTTQQILSWASDKK